MAEKEAAVAPFAHSTDIECLLCACYSSRCQGSVANHGQGRGAVCSVAANTGFRVCGEYKNNHETNSKLVCSNYQIVQAIQTMSDERLLPVRELPPLPGPSYTSAGALVVNKTSPNPCPCGADIPVGEGGNRASVIELPTAAVHRLT